MRHKANDAVGYASWTWNKYVKPMSAVG